MDSGDVLGTSDRVELLWPDKHAIVDVFQEQDGRWNVGKDASKASLRGLTNLNYYPKYVGGPTSLVISGQRLHALKILRRGLGPIFRLVYIDLPRLEVDDATTAFESVSPLRLTTWLAMVRALLLETRELMNRKGVLAVHCGENESQYAKLLIDELFRDKRVGTVIWQKTYSGQNMKGMKEFTDAHDLIYLYARDKDGLPAVGLRKQPEGYSNLDYDPRGGWKAEHKGAKTRRANSDFDTYQPPYRWRISHGELPPGIWRLSPFTGVIWGKPTTVGKYTFTVEVSDASGRTDTKTFRIDIKDSGIPPSLPEIPWIFQENHEKGPLQIGTTTLPSGIVGDNYSAVILAQGGKPYRGPPIRPGSGRYWDFAKATLIAAYQHDSVYLGSRHPTSIPTPKKYEPSEGILEIENQQSVWLGRVRENGSKAPEAFAGFTEDATKHLKALKQLGLIESEVATAKPEKLLTRLLDIFTDKGDFVLEVISSTADLAATALKAGRHFVSLQGFAPRDVAVTAACALPRLKAIIAGEDQNLEERAPEIRLSAGAYVPFGGGGNFASADVGKELAFLLAGEDQASLSDEVEHMTEADLIAAVLTAEGYLPPHAGQRFAFGIDGRGRALVVPPSAYLTPELAAEVASDNDERTEDQATTIYYFRAIENIDESLFGGRIALRRVPFDLLRLDIG
jgi:hypothetical protein